MRRRSENENNTPWRILFSSLLTPSLIGDHGKNVRLFQEDSGAFIDIAKPEDANYWGDREVLIRGDDQAKRSALELIIRFALKEGTKPVVTCLVPASAVSHIIGTKGAKIKALQANTETNIMIPKNQQGPFNTVIITGAQVSAVVDCVQKVHDIAEANQDAQNADPASASPQHLRALQFSQAASFFPSSASHCATAFAQSAQHGMAYVGQYVTGQPVFNGYQMVPCAMPYPYRLVDPRQHVEAERRPSADWVLLVPSSVTSALVGAKGVVIREVEEVTGCSVNVAKANDTSTGTDRSVIFRGTEDAKASALRMVLHRLACAREYAQASSMPAIKFLIPTRAGGLVIGKQGKNISITSQQTGAHIDVSREPANFPQGGRVVKVSGDVSSIIGAADRIFRIVASSRENKPSDNQPLKRDDEPAKEIDTPESIEETKVEVTSTEE